MEEFGFIDYKKPFGKNDDMRTSTYRGHVHITDTMLGNELNTKVDENRLYYEDYHLETSRTSNYSRNYTWKFEDPNNVRNPTLKPNLDFLKTYEECKLRLMKRPIRPACSVSHQDYLWLEPQHFPPVSSIPVPSKIAVSQVTIERGKPGFAKYLDPSATSTNLAYASFTPQELMGGIAAKDNITFWNWDDIHNVPQRVFREKDHELCPYLPAKECPKRRCEFQCTVKHVPNGGLSTEIRENYWNPAKREQEVDLTGIRNDLLFFPPVAFSTDRESKLIGSGERIQKYV